MIPLRMMLATSLILLTPVFDKAAVESNQQIYLGIYLLINDAGQRQNQKDCLGALARCKMSEIFLEGLRQRDPAWEATLVSRRVEDSQAEASALQPRAEAQVLASLGTTLSSGGPPSTFFMRGFDWKKTMTVWKP